MKTFLYFLATILHVVGYKVILYPGSHVKKENYARLQEEMENRFGAKHNISFREYKPFYKYENDTILVGHSFGSTFSLIDAMRYPDKIKGVILLNGHFNSRNKMLYPGIDQKNVVQPVLTILGTNDTKLPFWKAIDDLYYKKIMGIPNKHYLVNEGFDHFTGLNDNFSSILADQIDTFINNITNYSVEKQESKWIWFNKPVVFPATIDISRSIHVIDAMILASGCPFWHIGHFILFLLSKPEYMNNYQFSGDFDYLLKTADKVSIDDVKNFLDANIVQENIVWHETILPTIHPSILIWLFKQPYLKKKSNGEMEGELIVLPVNQDVTYYKFPSRFAYLKNKYLKQ
jgi:hypothetical protein